MYHLEPTMNKSYLETLGWVRQLESNESVEIFKDKIFTGVQTKATIT